VMKFRGREIVYMNSGRELLENSIKSLMNSGEIGEALKSEGKNLSIILFPS
jgi:translation initiation factor IF-3